jgi:peptide/nickel transport system permease protein
MPVYLTRRLIYTVFILLCVSLVTFSFMYLIPGDPAYIIAERRYGHEAAAQGAERVREELGLDQPAWVQYGRWLAQLARGSFGESYRTGNPVMQEIAAKLPATIQLALAALVFSLVIALPAGIFAAARPHSLWDSAGMLGAMLGVSLPNFWLGLLLILFFSVRLGWTPVYGHGTLLHLVLPALTLGTGLAAVTARLTRSSMLEVLNQDYIKTARAKGLRESLILGKHAFKNAGIPVLTVIGLQFGSLLEGAVVVEVIFAWPGVGRLLVDSIFARDFPVIQGCVFIIALMYVAVNLLVDLSYLWLDPKIRYER